jgi:cell division transport system permease protein
MILYYLKETFNSLFTSKMGSLLIITTTAIAIIFVTFSAGLVAFSNSINKKLKDNISISLFIQDTVAQKSFKKIESELKENVYLESFKLVSKAEALKTMEEKAGKDFLSVLEYNPLPASYTVKLHSDSVSTQTIEPIIASLQSVYGIEEVVYDYSLTLKILNFINSSKKIIYGGSLFLVLLSIYLVFSNNRLLLSSRVTQYNAMKLVGAKLRTIKIPILLNGIIMGIIAALICIGLYYVLIDFVDNYYRIPLIDFNINYFIGLILLLGMFLGFLGSFLATLNVSLKVNRVK